MNKYLLLFLPLFLLAVFLFGLAPVKAQYGLDETVGKTSYSKTDTPESVTTTIINTALYLVYFAFFILVLYAGIRWMTAQGNEEHVTKAKNILEAAIIGLAVISMAYAITNFVLGKVGAGKVAEENGTVPVIIKGCVPSDNDLDGICSVRAVSFPPCMADLCEVNASGVCKGKPGKTTADFCGQFPSETSCSVATISLYCTWKD